MLLFENYLTSAKKRAILCEETGCDEEMSLQKAAQRGSSVGCKRICQVLRDLPLPSRAPKEGAPGPPVTEAMSGSFSRSCKQGGTVEYI